jgi:hypothetical protein
MIRSWNPSLTVALLLASAPTWANVGAPVGPGVVGAGGLGTRCKPLGSYTSAPVPGGAASVDSYGAKGDGVTVDDSAIARAVAAAGPGGTVVFTGGKTYILCQPQMTLSGQRWTRAGALPAVLKRCDVRLAHLVASVATDATYVDVDDASSFRAGMWITVVNATGNSHDDGDVVHHPVLSVVGNRINFYNGLSRAFVAGDKVITSFHLVQAGAGSLIDGLTFDGNRGHNDEFVCWERHDSVWLTGDGARVRGCYFRDAQGDAVSINGASDGVVEKSYFHGLNGSAIHFSFATRPQVSENVMNSTNERAARTKHAEAAVTWSLQNQDVLVTHNCIENGSTKAFGDIMIHGGNRGVRIENNWILGMAGGLLSVIDINGTAMDLVFANNTAIDVGGSNVQSDHAAINSKNVRIYRNDVTNGYFALTGIEHASVEYNRIEMIDQAHFGDNFGQFNNQAALITLIRGADVAIAGNYVQGGNKGIYVSNGLYPSNVLSSNVQVIDNAIVDQIREGITIGNTVHSTIDGDPMSDLRGIIVHDNLLRSAYLTSGSVLARIGRHAEFLDNCVDSNQSGLTVIGDASAGASGKSYYRGNRIFAGGAALTTLGTSVHGLVFEDNVLNNPIPSNITAAGDNVLSGNRLDAMTRCPIAPVP